MKSPFGIRHAAPEARRATLVGIAAATFFSVASVAGCAAEADPVTAKRATVEQIAGKINGCKPQPAPGRLKGYRQSSCKTSSGYYVINTFTTDPGQAAWLEHAKLYGGTYLVGPKWIVVGGRSSLEQLRKKIGGKIHTRNTKTNRQKPYP